MNAPDVVARNLRKLLGRSYVPVRPGAAFRRELRERVVGAVGGTPLPGGARPARLAPLFAAAAVVLAATALFLGTRGESPPPSVTALVARGAVALRNAPDGVWQAATAGHVVLPEQAYLEVRTPAAASFVVEAVPLGTIEVAADSRLELASSTAGSPGAVRLTAWLRDGALRVRRDGEDSRWIVTTPDGTLELGPADVDVRRLADATRVAVAAGDVLLRHAGGGVPLAPGPDWIVRAAAAPERVTPDRPDVSALREEAAGATPPPSPPPKPPAAAPPARATIRGTVRDAASGLPVGAFTVTLLAIARHGTPAYGESPARFAVQDAAGQFAVEDVRPGVYRLFVTASEHATWSSAPIDIEDEGMPAPVAALLARGVTVRGRVVNDADGQPLAGVLVLSQTDTAQLALPIQDDMIEEVEDQSRMTRTDVDGRFELTRLAPGVQTLRASRDGVAPAWLRLAELAPGDVREGVEFRMQFGGRLAGRVLRPDGSPWEGALVLAMLQQGDPHGRPFGLGVADAAGEYVVHDLPSGFHVAILMAGEEATGVTDAVRVVPIQIEGGRTVTLHFGDAAGRTRLTGMLLDETGTPVPRMTLSLAPVGPGGVSDSDWLGTNTDDAGRFELPDVPPGTHEMFVADAAGIAIHSIGTVLVPAVRAHRHDFVLPSGGLAGRVAGADGAAGAHAVVILERAAAGDSHQFAAKVLTAPDGSFRFPYLTAGIYRISAYPTAGPYGTGVAGGLHVDPGQVREGADIRLPPGGALVVTTVDPAGTPVAGVPIEAIDAAGVRFEGGRDPQTGADGTLRLDGLAVGVWTVHARPDGRPAVRGTVTVVAGAATSITLELKP